MLAIALIRSKGQRMMHWLPKCDHFGWTARSFDKRDETYRLKQQAKESEEKKDNVECEIIQPQQEAQTLIGTCTVGGQDHRTRHAQVQEVHSPRCEM